MNIAQGKSKVRHYLYLAPDGGASGDLVTHVAFPDDVEARKWAREQPLTAGARRWTLFRLAEQGLVSVESSTAVAYA
ncbi:hypothetical protein BH09ACT10_BH09ACT10_26730 [soil metagenome]